LGVVFNLDEVGVSECDDGRPKKTLVPAAMGRQTIHHGVNRNFKHITIVTCVAVSGEYGIPDVITSHDWENLRQGLRKKGIEFARHLTLKKSHKAEVNGNSFAEYANPHSSLVS
jgi:hypothetical protein